MSEKQLSDKEKALLILKEATNAFNECQKQLRATQYAFNDLSKSFDYMKRTLQRTLNEEELGKNVHKDCEYYNSKTDVCLNYMMGKYTGLAFEVSRHEYCIKDIIKGEGDND